MRVDLFPICPASHVTMGCDQGGPASAPGCRDRTTSCPRRPAAAAWVSLLLRQPLLLHRRSGGWQVAVRGEAHKRYCVSNRLQWFRSRARRPAAICFYRFNNLARFRDTLENPLRGGPDWAAPLHPKARPMSSYVQLQGLGGAIVRWAGPRAAVKLDPSMDRQEIFGDPYAATAS